MELLRFPPRDEQIVHGCCALFQKKYPRPSWNKGTVSEPFYIALADARLGDIDLEFVLCQRIIVEHVDRLVGIRLGGHGHESEALRLAGALIHGDFHRRDGSSGCKQGVDLILRGGLVQVSYVNSYIHCITAFCPNGHMSGSAGIKMTANPIKGSAAKGCDRDPVIIT